MPRFHCPLPLLPGHSCALPDEVARHAIGALRLRDGEAVTLFNGDGAEYDGVLETRGRGAAVQIGARREVSRESALRLTLVQGVSSGERMDLTIQKAVELGAAAIQPVLMRRTVVKLTGDKLERRRAHWQAVAISACEQCGRNVVPEVAPITDFMDWLRGPSPAGRLLLLDPEAETSLHRLGVPEGPVTLLAGPEGGFDPAERRAALAVGGISVRLGPRILRTETAALAALAAMQALWGDFA
ncbi:MAG: 16S rRNA (uracil(1498)-N(3))-methyltransferase [Betaproteobacteria bacterium]|nr:16S rRNA (uracil(1498)-N(3))-methyltransferase [Betaproteobacteria bacterium]